MSNFKPLPIEELEAAGATSHNLWPALGDNGTPDSLVGFYNRAKAAYDELASIRAAQGSAESKLETFDGEESRTYRQWKAKAESRSASIDAEYAEELRNLHNRIQEIKGLAAARKSQISSTLKDQKAKAIEEISKSVAPNTDFAAKVSQYKELTDLFHSTAKLFVDYPATDAFTALKGFRLPGPGGATNSTGKDKAEGGKRFRWGTITVHLPGGPLTLTNPTTKEISDKVGIKAQDHFLTQLLTSLNGNWLNLPREGTDNDTPHTFVTSTGYTVDLILRKATPRKAAEVAEPTSADADVSDVETLDQAA